MQHLFPCGTDPQYSQPLPLDAEALLSSFLPAGAAVADAPLEVTLDGAQPVTVLARRRHTMYNITACNVQVTLLARPRRLPAETVGAGGPPRSVSLLRPMELKTFRARIRS